MNITAIVALFLALTAFGCGESDEPVIVKQPASDGEITAICQGAPAKHLCTQACLDCAKQNTCAAVWAPGGACVDLCKACPDA